MIFFNTHKTFFYLVFQLVDNANAESIYGYDSSYRKLLWCLVVFFISICLQLWFQPYTNTELNRLELFGLLTSFITLYIGLWNFTPKPNEEWIKLLVSSIVIPLNLIWFLYCGSLYFRNAIHFCRKEETKKLVGRVLSCVFNYGKLLKDRIVYLGLMCKLGLVACWKKCCWKLDSTSKTRVESRVESREIVMPQIHPYHAKQCTDAGAGLVMKNPLCSGHK